MRNGDPKISCICVTHHHLTFLQRAVRCFQRQAYANKELIVACLSENTSVLEWLKHLQDPAIKILLFPSDSPLTLGEKRNAAIEFSDGEYWCTWDDDDLHHPDRLTIQMGLLRGSEYKSAALSRVILHHAPTASAYISARRNAWEQTVLCERSLSLGNPLFRYVARQKGEDSSLLYQLKENDFLLSIDRPDLYIYTYHGSNTFHREHWEVNLLPWAKKMQPEDTHVILGLLDGDISSEETRSSLEALSRKLAGW